MAGGRSEKGAGARAGTASGRTRGGERSRARGQDHGRSRSSTRDGGRRQEGPAPSNELTIEQLAATVGMSVRNIRNHHTRGLLPAPEVRARVGFYGADHVARLRLVQDLQADGFNLAAIERLLSGSDGLAARLLGPRQALTTPLQPEQPGPITPAPPDQGLRG